MASGHEPGAEHSGAAAMGRRHGWVSWVIAFGAVGLILWLTPGALNLSALPNATLKAPDLAPLLRQSALVQVHVATVAVALLLGPVQFLARKGTPAHKLIGWIWVASMGVTALTTLFIRDINDGAFSGIHLFSLMTLIGLPWAVWLARTGRTAGHARAMIGLYIGLVIAGVTAIAPGRLVWEMFFR